MNAAHLVECCIEDALGDGYQDDEFGLAHVVNDLCERLEWQGRPGTEIERYDLAETLIEDRLAVRPFDAAP